MSSAASPLCADLVPGLKYITFPMPERFGVVYLQLGRPRFRLENNIKSELIEIGLEAVDLINLASNTGQCRALVSRVMNLRLT